jgi:hypothetical protein
MDKIDHQSDFDRKFDPNRSRRQFVSAGLVAVPHEAFGWAGPASAQTQHELLRVFSVAGMLLLYSGAGHIELSHYC